jgi:methyl-accepting chemotaxis protein
MSKFELISTTLSVTTLTILIFLLFFFQKRINTYFRLILKQRWFVNLNFALVYFGTGTAIWFYQSQLSDLLSDPPKWIFVFPIVLYYLTVLSNANKDRAEAFKSQVDDLKTLAKSQKSAEAAIKITITELDNSQSKLNAQSTRVRKMTVKLKNTQLSLEDQITRLGTDFKEFCEQVNTKFGHIEDDVESLRSDVNTLKSDVSELKSDVSELKSDVSELKSDVSELKSDVSSLKTDVKTILELLRSR